MELKDLKPGDKVLVTHRHGVYIAEVKRLTKTQVLVGDGERRFRICDGHNVGGDIWSSSLISIPTDEDYKRIHEKQRRDKIWSELRKIALDSLSTDKLEQILKIAKE